MKRMIGKEKRLSRLFNPSSRRMVLIPLDHGVTSGPIEGIGRIRPTIESMVESGADGLLLHKGMIAQNSDILTRAGLGLVMHLSAGTTAGRETFRKVLTGSVEEALAMGCDAVSVQVNLGTEGESDMLRDLSGVATQCFRYGVPLLAMMYSRSSVISGVDHSISVKHAARIGAELGADLIKVAYTGDPESFAEVVEACPVPVLVAGGDKITDEARLFRLVAEALEAGALGISVGRNIFQSPYPGNLLQAINRIVHGKAGWLSAYHFYRSLSRMESFP